MNKEKSESIIEGIFVDAYKQDGLEYLYTLLRVTGLPFNVSDLLLTLRLKLEEETNPSDEEFENSFAALLIEDVFELIANLLRLIKGMPYTNSPFFKLKKGLGFEPSLIDKIRFLIRTAREAGKTDFSYLLETAYPTEVIEKSVSQHNVEIAELREAYNRCSSFTRNLLITYHQQRLNYRGHQQFTKLPGYQIIELLVDDEHGVYGFYAHFPSGSKAHFIRRPDKMLGQNFLVGDRITPFVGLLPFPEEWLVNEKRLHELGLNGRYNQPGEWKPIVYPSLPNKLIQEALSSSSDNDVQGSLFYILTTGYRVIEFVVQTTVDLPHESFSFGKHFHLLKCPPYESSPLHQNTRIYDGWLELNSVDPEYIREAIAEIGMAVNRMAFAYDAKAEWRVKYRLADIRETLFAPSEEDTHILDSLLRNFPSTDDAMLLEAAMDWYNRARISNNVFASFLSYYISVESVAVAIASGKADFGIGYQRESKSERRERRDKCIEEKFNSLYASNPGKFIEEAYFDCVVTLKKKTRRVAELVFGAEHLYLSLLFEKREEAPSLNDIRSNLAHGSFSLVDRDQEALVAARLPEIAQIAKEFLTRVIFSLKPSDALPTWSLNFTKSQKSVADPRATLVIVSEQGLITDDWKIRPEWIS
jgi:hypothetical protein